MKNGVVIVTYNRLSLLRECVSCVLGQTVPFSHVIIVDNCSTDGTGDYLGNLKAEADAGGQDSAKLEINDPRITVISDRENLGGAGGFYEGIRVAQDLNLDWILIIDDDAMLRDNYNEIMTRFAAEHPETVALAGSVCVDGKIHTMHRRNVSSRLLFVEKEIPKERYRENSFSCDCATFCGLMVRGDIQRKIGLPEKDYFLWYDDSEYSLRLSAYGGICCVPEAVLDHKTVLPKETEGLLERTSWRHYYGYRNRYDAARRHFGSWSARMIGLEYHVLSLLSRLMMLNPKTREKGRFNVKMIHDALKDARTGKLGKNEAYRP